MTDGSRASSKDAADVVFLHTAPVHVQTFDGLLREMRPATRVRHVVREDLLAAAQRAGTTDPEVRRMVADAVRACARGGDTVVLCTCSTIGGLAESAGAKADLRVLRVDRAMAERAVDIGATIVVAAALDSTLAPTETLIIESAQRAGKTVHIRRLLIDGAWSLFEQGDFDGYLERLAAGLESAPPCDVIVLAQASMAGAAALCRHLTVPVLSSPRLGLESALANSPSHGKRIR